MPMEDSANRRERLKAMRMEASSSSAEGSSPSFSTTNTPLTNPLIHSAVPALECSTPPHRFDFYSDPVAAFSAPKRMTSNSGGSRRHGGYFQRPDFSSPISAPRPIAGQMDDHMFPSYTSHAIQFPTQNPCLNDTPLPRFQSDSWRTPVQHLSPTSGNTGTHNFSRPWNMSENSSGLSYYSNSSKGGPSSSRLGQSPMNTACSSIRGSPHSNSSGRGWQYRGGSPSPGWSGGRGRGGYRNKGYGQQLDSFYVKSMVKDPWRKLKPVIGNILMPLAGPQSWHPTSITSKKVKVVETVIDLKPKQNLAEFLALAFEETISDKQEGEGLIMSNPNDHADHVG